MICSTAPSLSSPVIVGCSVKDSLHVKDGPHYRPVIRDLLRAFDNVDPPTSRQPALTPKFLRTLYSSGRRRRPDRSLFEHAADLIIASYFFACRSCEFCVTPTPGATKRLRLRNISFGDADGNAIQHMDPFLQERAQQVTLCFEDQKNRQKFEYRTHHCTGDRILCPVRRFSALVTRIHRTVPDVTADTSICAAVDDNLTPLLIDNTFTLSFMRSTCATYGGVDVFGFEPTQIGNKSIRSGAAMTLFMARHSPDRIMLLGRWKSLSFMDYLRPQVLSWTLNMSKDMIRLEHFLEPSATHKTKAAPSTTNDGRTVEIPSINVDYDRPTKMMMARQSLGWERKHPVSYQKGCRI